VYIPAGISEAGGDISLTSRGGIIRIRDLENWPPKASESNDSYCISHPELDVMKKVVHVQTNWMIFECESIGNREDQHAYYFEINDEATFLNFKAILEENVGESLLSIGNIEIPAVHAA
jgi:hypothetical protein